MAITAPETILRERILTVMNAEFNPDITFISDKLHDSLAQNGPVGAVYTGPAEEKLGQGIVQNTVCYIQLFHRWNPKVDPQQVVDPSLIEQDAERLRRATRADGDLLVGDAHLWYYRVTKVDYPPDPTGNLTRLLATVVAESQNAAIVETNG